jgi:GAF domain-containing protein
MRRRSKAGVKTAKAQRRGRVKRRGKPSRDRHSSVDLQQFALRTQELSQALERQTATADILKVISHSSFDLQIVLDTLVESAVRLCRADNVVIFLQEAENYGLAANYGYSREYEDFMRRHPIAPGRGTIAGRTLLERRPVHVLDIQADPDYTMVEAQRLGGFRTMLGVPLMRDGTPIGVMTLLRNTVQPFSDAQTDLATTFADQAVIAIENTRLLKELRRSLDQQTATADVLRVISSSPGELEPVFQAMLENATRICEAKFGLLFRFDGRAFQMAAGVDLPSHYAEYVKQRGLFLPPTNTLLDRAMKTKQMSYTADMAADASPGSPARLAGARSAVAVPMLKDNNLTGVIVIYRQEVRPFTDKQIELLRLLGAARSAGATPEIYEKAKIAVAALQPGDTSLAAERSRGLVMNHRDWLATDQARQRLKEQWRRLFREWDIVLYPPAPFPAFPHDHSLPIEARHIEIDGEAHSYNDAFYV